MTTKIDTRNGPSPSPARSAPVTKPYEKGAVAAKADEGDDEPLLDLQEQFKAELEAAVAAGGDDTDVDDPLPACVTEEPDGSWLFRLQHPLEPKKDDPTGIEVEKIRIPVKVYARHVRDADRNGRGSIDVMLHLAASMTGVPHRVLERLDTRDFSTLSDLISRRTRGLPT